jgi:hypothetical protein
MKERKEKKTKRFLSDVFPGGQISGLRRALGRQVTSQGRSVSPLLSPGVLRYRGGRADFHHPVRLWHLQSVPQGAAQHCPAKLRPPTRQNCQVSKELKSARCSYFLSTEVSLLSFRLENLRLCELN